MNLEEACEAGLRLQELSREIHGVRGMVSRPEKRDAECEAKTIERELRAALHRERKAKQQP